MKILIFIISFFSFNILLGQKIIYVSPNGNDENSGTKALPVYSINKAIALIGNESKNVNIKIASGNYFYTKPILLDEHIKANIKISGDVGSFPIFYGGNKLVLKNDIEKPFIQANDVYQSNQFLSLNANLRNITKLPKNQFYKATAVAQNQSGFSIKISKDLNDLLKTYKYDVKNLYVTFYVKWTTIIQHISSYDPSTSSLYFNEISLPDFYQIEANKTNFTIHNLPLNMENGDWCFKSDNQVMYKPKKGETLGNMQLVNSSLEYIINFDNFGTKYNNSISFENVEFNTVGVGIDKNGYFPYQAGAKVDAVIRIKNAKNITFNNIKARNILSNVFWIRGNSQNIEIRHSDFRDLGAGAIKIGDLVYSGSNSITNNIIIDNNIMTNGGLIFPDAAAVIIFNAYSNTISHNDISNFSYSGISVGWVWGYDKSVTNNNKITNNHIYNIGRGDLDDLAGIYTLGVSPGTVIQNNVIHDIQFHDYGAWGIYLDEGSSNIMIKDNLIYNCQSAGFHLHYGRDNSLENNIFAYNTNYALEASKVENHNSLNIRGNIIVQENGIIGNDYMNRLSKNVENNIYYSSKKITQNNFNSNRGKMTLLNPILRKKEYYFEILNTSVLNKTDYKRVDFSTAGLYGSDSWRKSSPYYK